MKIVVLLTIFWAMQAAAQAAFGFGSSAPSRWWVGFVIGNIIGVSSIMVLMRLYAGGDTGLACALGTGGAFVAGQIALAIVSRQPPALGQWACILIIAAGMTGYALLAKPTVPAAAQTADHATSDNDALDATSSISATQR